MSSSGRNTFQSGDSTKAGDTAFLSHSRVAHHMFIQVRPYFSVFGVGGVPIRVNRMSRAQVADRDGRVRSERS